MEYTVLFVDDDPLILEGLRRLLHGQGFRVRCARGADEALRLLRSDKIHLVITDQVMPGISGTEFLYQVRRLFPDIILFLLTGHATVEMVMEALNKIGVERIYLKPCNHEELVLGIRQTLQKRALFDQARQIVEAAQASSKRAPRLHATAGEKSCEEIVLEEMPFGWATLLRKIESMNDSKT